MNAGWLVTVLATASAMAQEGDWGVKPLEEEWSNPPEPIRSLEPLSERSAPESSEDLSGLQPYDPPSLQYADPHQDGAFTKLGDLLQPASLPPAPVREIPMLIDPDKVVWEEGEVTDRVLVQRAVGNVSVLGSTAGGAVTAAEPLPSALGWKVFQGLDAVPDHEVAAGFALPISRSGTVGAVYRTIQPDAQWGTDRYWGAGATPVRVEHSENHGVVLLLRFRF